MAATRLASAIPLLILPILGAAPLAARGADPAAPAPPPASPGTAVAPAAPPPDLTPRPPPSLDFTLLGETPGARAGDAALAEKVARRRTFLQAHQAAGLATWALMGTTVVVGQLNYHDLYGGGGYTQRYRTTHRALGYATASSFAFTGLLAALAPVPYPKPLRLDTTTVHKGSMALAGLGVVTQVVLGVWARHQVGQPNQAAIARTHQAIGYGTFAAMTVGAITLVF